MKKLLSILLSLTLIVSSFAISSTAFARESKSAKVFLSAVYFGDNLFDPVTKSVSADLDKTYDVGYTDDTEEPTILDAIIAMQIETFGEEDFALDPQTYFSVGTSGWITTCFGDDASMSMYYHNGASASGVTEPLADGDYIEYTMMFSDNYAYFNSRKIGAELNRAVTFTLYSDGYDSKWNYITGMKVEGATVYVDGAEYGTTDKDGKIDITFTFEGIHNVTAKKDNLMIPYCEVVCNHFVGYMSGQIRNATDFLKENGTTYGADSLSNLLSFATLYDARPAKFENELETVLLGAKENMDKNDGKLMYVDYYGDTEEDAAGYSALIMLANANGDASDFYGYNLYELMESLSPSLVSNPYNYRFAIANARAEYKDKLCDAFIKNYYTLGKGMNYWGYSCDNTAMFITAMSTASSKYDKYIDDALKVMATYITSTGAGYSKDYPEENADSTALTVMAYASVGQYSNALRMYMRLVNNFQSGRKGVMLATINGKKVRNAIATKDGLLGISALYKYAVKNSKDYHPYRTELTPATTTSTGESKNICFACGEELISSKIPRIQTVKLSKTSYTYDGNAKKPTVTVTDVKGNTVLSKYYTVKYSENKAAGKATAYITFKGNYSGTVQKSFSIKPNGTKLSTVSAKSKGMAITWKAQTTQVTGYQIQIATNSQFTSNAKTYAVSNKTTTSKSISGLKAKKTYFVRIRTYKTVDGKKYYSSWSETKTATTKA